MVQYIVKLAEKVVELAEQGQLGEVLPLRFGLAEELDRLDPRDFLPAARYDFVVARLKVRSFATQTGFSSGMLPSVASFAKEVIRILAQYGGDGSRVVSRSFAFIKDSDLRRLIERDFRELGLKVFPGGAWKSTVVLAGSILEAILYDQLGDSVTKPRALASPKAPRDKMAKWKDRVPVDWTRAN